MSTSLFTRIRQLVAAEKRYAIDDPNLNHHHREHLCQLAAQVESSQYELAVAIGAGKELQRQQDRFLALADHWQKTAQRLEENGCADLAQGALHKARAEKAHAEDLRAAIAAARAKIEKQRIHADRVALAWDSLRDGGFNGLPA
jgi:hypothetical protein